MKMFPNEINIKTSIISTICFFSFAFNKFFRFVCNKHNTYKKIELNMRVIDNNLENF